jgi:hypothetical protein
MASLADSFRYAKASCIGDRFVYGLYPLLKLWALDGTGHHFLDSFHDLWAATAPARESVVSKDPVPYRLAGHLVSVPAYPLDVFGVGRKLQQRLCHADAASEFDRMTAPPAPDDKPACMMRATLLSGNQKGAKGFWMVLPTDEHLSLTNEEFFIYVRLRLSLPFTTRDIGRDCARCRASFDTNSEFIYHLSACHGGAGGTTLHRRHDVFRSTVLDFLAYCGVLADPLEPRRTLFDFLRNGVTQGGTDIAAWCILHDGDAWQFDIHLVSATHNSQARLPRSSPLTAAIAGEKKKNNDYLSLCTDNHVQFLPLVFEIEGAFSASTLRFINMMRRRMHGQSSLARGLAADDDFTHRKLQYWVQRLTISLARQTARHILDGIAAPYGLPTHAGKLPGDSFVTSFWPSTNVLDLGSVDA